MILLQVAACESNVADGGLQRHGGFCAGLPRGSCRGGAFVVDPRGAQHRGDGGHFRPQRFGAGGQSGTFRGGAVASGAVGGRSRNMATWKVVEVVV